MLHVIDVPTVALELYTASSTQLAVISGEPVLKQ
jgi:hypothetical protein